MAKTTDLTREDGISAADERTPLLPSQPGPLATSERDGLLSSHVDDNGAPAGPQDDAPVEEDEKPMPYVQVLLLCYAALAEPVAYFAIFPFINEMLEVIGGLKESDVGFWSGLIESLFSLVQMVLMIFYGKAADRLGRKPVLVFSLAGVGIATCCFGLATSIWQMVLMRCIAGLFGGSVVTIRVMLSENTTKKTQPRAFSWYMFTRNMGLFIGPLIGGALANPAKELKGISKFFASQFFIDYPYALSTFVAGGVVLSASIVSLLFLKETRHRKVQGDSKPKPQMTTWEVLKAPGVSTVLFIFGHTMLLGLAYTAVSPVVQYTSIEKGGWAFSDQWIAYTIALAGVSQGLWMLVAFPILQKRFGTAAILRFCAIVWPTFMASYPILNEFLRHEWNTAFWVVGVPMVIFGSGVAMAFACVQLCINDISPSLTVLATVNSLALTVNSGIRAVAPVAFTSLFAVGIKLQWADGHLVWFLIVPMAAALNFSLVYLPVKAQGNPEDVQAAEEEHQQDDGVIR